MVNAIHESGQQQGITPVAGHPVPLPLPASRLTVPDSLRSKTLASRPGEQVLQLIGIRVAQDRVTCIKSSCLITVSQPSSPQPNGISLNEYMLVMGGESKGAMQKELAQLWVRRQQRIWPWNTAAARHRKCLWPDNVSSHDSHVDVSRNGMLSQDSWAEGFQPRENHRFLRAIQQLHMSTYITEIHCLELECESTEKWSCTFNTAKKCSCLSVWPIVKACCQHIDIVRGVKYEVSVGEYILEM